MNRNVVLSAFVVLAASAAASAHVTVSPRESKPGVQEKYTVRVPTEGQVTTTLEAWLRAYDAAFVARDLTTLAGFYHPDVTIYEGGGINTGWADYRDNHLGPELKQFQNLRFSHSDIEAHVLGDGRSAYVISNYAIKARVGDRDVDSGGLETLVLVKADDGSWKIRHSHTSSRPLRAAAPGK
jgi:ketosteroid isomerase-like protein